MGPARVDALASYHPSVGQITSPGSLASLRTPLLIAAAVVVVAAALQAASGLFAVLAFSALAAILCRRLQLNLIGRGMGSRPALVITIGAFVVVLALLGLAFAASILALAVQLGKDADRIAGALQELAGNFGFVTGLPPDSVPSIDVSVLVSGARQLLGMVAPAMTGLAMSVIIVTYLLLDANGLRARMLRVMPEGFLVRYDALAAELVVYIRVRAVLAAAAAVADAVLLAVLGVPYAILWGVVSFLFSFVPNLGFALALIPPAVFALLDAGPLAGILVVGGYVAINLAFDYVIQPRMMSSSLDISPVVVIVSILAWTYLIGATGALLAVPLTIAMRAILVPYPGARWFVALLGPVPGEAAGPAAPAAPAAGAPAAPATEVARQ